MNYVENVGAIVIMLVILFYTSYRVDKWVGEDEKWKDFFGMLLLGCMASVIVVASLFFIGNMIPYEPPPDSVQVDLSEFFD